MDDSAHTPGPVDQISRQSMGEYQTARSSSSGSKTKLADAAEPTSVPQVPIDEDLPSPPPDGGLHAWLVAAGAFGLIMASGGMIVAWGTFQGYYQDNQLSTSSPSAIAWIGSIQYALGYLPCLLSGRLFDLGYSRSLLYVGSVSVVAANLLTAQCTRYYQFLLTQGILLGIGSSIVYTPAIGFISQWFSHKRPLIFAFTSMGNALGGIIYPIMFVKLQPTIGFQWTMRIFGFISLALCAFALLTLRDRRSHTKVTATKAPKFFELHGTLTSAPYVAYTFAIFVAYLGLFTPLTFISDQAQTLGISPSFGTYLVAIVNGSTIIGRLTCGVVAVRFGALNLMIVSTTLAMVFTYAWAYTTTIPSYVVVSCLYGISLGGFVSLFPVPAAQMGPLEDVGRRTGLLVTILAIGAIVGPPIAGAAKGNRPNYHIASLYAGSTIAVAAGIMLLAKYFQTGRLVRSRV
ncbi:MFS general substrate transporter [Sistotremastrum suecicum HHB10207 ss-3]|uniref:MFS general substrate transporter n=1 Tax=Sistotremastrum suecicum HHB10207 ss-3 TaxID=1314776 RepID=A0A166ASE8_9AGAM|nr:MFS general substrate transporter [Sistotremastrum suecicum HHB10207 ss-3]